MDIKSFLKLANRYKWLLILVPSAAIITTYFLVQNLPKQYKSNVEISTGLLDPTKRVISDETTDFFKVNEQFNSMMEKLKMKKSINMLSYNLILHDLEYPSKKFKKYSEKLDSLNQQQREDIIALYNEKRIARSILTLNDDEGKYKLYSIIESMGYGEDALRKKLDISHAESSDFISIEYVSEKADLSAFVVNTLASEFITDYTTDVNTNAINSNELLDSLVKKSEQAMNAANAKISAYKSSNGVINLSDQATSVNAQITKYEGLRADATTEIDKDEAALNTIATKLKTVDPDPTANIKANNRELLNLKRDIAAAMTIYSDHPTEANHKKIDSLSTLYNVKNDQSNLENTPDTRLARQALQTQQSNLDIQLGQARASLRSIDAELNTARAQYSKMMPYDANIQNLQTAADLATKDYTTKLDSYNKSKTSQNVNGFRLEIEQPGLPGNAEPSKRILYITGSGMGSFALCMGFLLILFALDNSVTSLSQLERVTKSKAIGGLNTLIGSERNTREIWNDKSGNRNYEIYRDLLRSLRFEISSKMDADKNKILGITSLVAGEGKTLISYGLAYAFAMTGKKILLIADELPVIRSESKELVNSQNFESFLIKKEITTEDLITIMNKNMVQTSLLESQSIKSLQAGFEVLRAEFDMIIIDVNSLHNMNIAKEWLLFTERNVAVFESGRSLGENDAEFIRYINSTPGFIGWILNKMPIQKA